MHSCFSCVLYCKLHKYPNKNELSHLTGEQFTFNWKLLVQPEGANTGVITEQNGGTLKLSHLIEGIYKFKVTVTAPDAYGETTTNVTVLPRK